MKLELQSVSVRNFLSYGNVPQQLDFIEGLNLIIGPNTGNGRSNGSGKCLRKNTEIIVDFDTEEIRNLFLQFCGNDLP